MPSAELLIKKTDQGHCHQQMLGRHDKQRSICVETQGGKRERDVEEKYVPVAKEMPSLLWPFSR